MNRPAPRRRGRPDPTARRTGLPDWMRGDLDYLRWKEEHGFELAASERAALEAHREHSAAPAHEEGGAP